MSQCLYDKSMRGRIQEGVIRWVNVSRSCVYIWIHPIHLRQYVCMCYGWWNGFLLHSMYQSLCSMLRLEVQQRYCWTKSNVSPGCHGNHSFDTPVFLLMTSMIALSLCWHLHITPVFRLVVTVRQKHRISKKEKNELFNILNITYLVLKDVN